MFLQDNLHFNISYLNELQDEEDLLYAGYIVSALVVLYERNLLTGDKAKANFKAIMRSNGKFARNIADALMELKRADLLGVDQAQANFEAVTYNGGHNAQSIAREIIDLSSQGLKSFDKNNFPNFFSKPDLPSSFNLRAGLLRLRPVSKLPYSFS